MDEQNNTEEQEQKNNNENTEEQSEEKKSSNVHIWKFVLLIVAIFLGTFAAVYTVIDMTMYHLGFQPFKLFSKEINRMIDDEFKYMDANSMTPVKIETKSDKYVVIINMKAFGNDINNFDTEIIENGIKIKGMYSKDKNGEKRENSFYQRVIFPLEIDSSGVKKEVKGNKVIISIPFKDLSEQD